MTATEITIGSLVNEYAQVHRKKRYGDTGWRSFPFILPHVLALQPRSIVDFGCGQSDLALRLARRAMIGRIGLYDPAIPELAEMPREQFNLLVNVDVLEHIPEEELDAAIAAMAAMADEAIVVIDTAPAKMHLSDGTNAHVSLHDEIWWLKRLQRSFPTMRPIVIGRRNRVGFKTFDQNLPDATAAILVREAVRSRNFERLLRLLGLAPRL